MAVNKAFVVKNGLEVADNLLFANNNKVGIGTTLPDYTLEVKGDVSLNNRLYLKTVDSFVKNATGIVSVTSPSAITGLNTSLIKVGDSIDDGPGGVLRAETRIVSIGNSFVGISPNHTRFSSAPLTINVTIVRNQTSGDEDQIIVSGGEFGSAKWIDLPRTEIKQDTTNQNLFPTFVDGIGRTDFKINSDKLTFNPFLGNLGIGTTNPEFNLDVTGTARVTGLTTLTNLFSEFAEISTLDSSIADITSLDSEQINVGILTAETLISSASSLGISSAISYTAEEDITAQQYYGNGDTLVGIVTNLIPGIGIDLFPTQSPGNKGEVLIQSYKPIGKTVYVSQTGDDNNTGLAENHPKRTIKAAAAISFPGDTIKVFPGMYVEDNPIRLLKNVAVEGTELRNCVVTPKFYDRDLFHVNNSCHITDLSFIGTQDMSDSAAIVALQPLEGVSIDRFFDAARMIRYNLDFIAAETVGFLTSTDYKNPAFVVVDSQGNPIDPVKCQQDVKDVFKSVISDITRGGNSKCVGAGKSYFDEEWNLLHITGSDPNGYSVKEATIDGLAYAAGIARSCVNNILWEGNYQNKFSQLRDFLIQKDPLTDSNEDLDSCSNVISAIYSCVGIVTTIINSAENSGITTTYPGNSGFGITSILGITDVDYDNESGTTVITVPGFNVKKGDIVEIRDVAFECPSNGSISTLSYPSGKYGYLFDVTDVDEDQFTVNVGTSTIPHTYAGNGFVVNRAFNITNALYNNVTGITTITAENSKIRTGQTVTIRDLEFSCPSGSGTTTIYPTGSEGFDFRVLDVVIDKPFNVSTAVYNNISGIVTITAPGLTVSVNDVVEVRDLEFSCPDSPPNLLYPSGKNDYAFKVLSASNSTFSINVGVSTIVHTYVSGGFVINRTQRENDTFTIQVGPSTIPHTYVSGGVAIPEYSPGVGPITQGPYVRNCTNFVSKSIGMKVDGFAAEPGDQDDIGVTGTMSVDSYTQFNQAGIGVSITNGAYAQLVSIFTICNETAIFTGSGGQCDITNSNSSFGTFGLVSNGVGDAKTKSIYRYTGVAATTAQAEQATITVSEIGNYRPYDGQALYFGELFFTVQRVEVINGGSGYTSPPVVTFENPPPGVNGIRAEAIATIQNGSIVSIDLISTGTQYRTPPAITLTGGGGSGAQVRAVMAPIYYTIESATLPSSGASTITLNNNLNSTVSTGTTVYFTRLSLQITSSHSFEWVGSGNDITRAKPALGGVVITDNEVVKIDGGEVVYTSTDQAGNFRIGDGLVVNQLTGTVSGRAFNQSLINTVTPLIVALAN
jgi:hypothetical protein